MPSDEMVEKVARAICNSGKFETGQGGCAAICMSMLGSSRPNCAHVVQVHGKLAKAALSAAHAEPVAWRTKRHPQEIGHALTDAGMTADEWRRRGFAVEPLFTRPPSEAAIRADERSATCKEGLQVEEIRQAILDHCWGDSNGNVNGSILAAEAIATAIRVRGER